MHEAIRKHHISFKNAFAGLWWALTSQPNFRIHFLFSLIALLAGVYFGLTNIEMTIILFTILLGLAAEMVNTSIEAMTDLITTQWRVEAKIAKDVSAGMMLLVATGAILIAFFIFWPHVQAFFF